MNKSIVSAGGRAFVLIGAALAAPILVASPARADDPKLEVKARLVPASLPPGGVSVLELELNFPVGWHLWSLDPGPGPRALRVALDAKGPLTFEGDFFGDPPEASFDRGFQRELMVYDQGPVRLRRMVRLSKDAAVGDTSANLTVKGQICAEACIDQSAGPLLSFKVDPAAPLAAIGTISGERLKLASAAVVEAPAQLAKAPASIDDLTQQGVLPFILMAFLFGLGALATPCVFPAIPLTISFFSKYASESFGRGARLAATYAGTIVLSFTAAGVLISILFGVTGIQRFAAAPLFNLLLGLLLIFFSLNLLGLFEIQAPQFMVGFVNKLESRFGRGASLAGAAAGAQKSGLGDYVVVSVAALTATTVFFTCTVGFVGLVLVAAANGAWFWPTIGMLAFASAFALPFFFLAMFPQAAQRLRGKGGGWLGATRVTLGFLELAAATKFLSNADLVWATNLLSREVVLSFIVPLFILGGMYLLGKIRMGHEHAAGPDGTVPVLQMLAGGVMFAVALYLATGLFGGRSFGGWIDGWLPPLTASAAGGVAGGSGPSAALEFLTSRAQAKPIALAEKKLVFVNYTGVTCTNCRYMEGGVFTRPEIRALLDRFVRVELYTDRDTQETNDNRADQVQRFKTAALPFYAVETADGVVLASFPSSTNDPAEFEKFLRDALASDAGAPVVGAGEAPKALLFQVGRLSDKKPAAVIQAGKWNLVNFWATWCGPCREELSEFMAAMGKDLEARGGHFVTIATEQEDAVAEAAGYMKQLGVPEDRALWLAEGGRVDERLGFNGSVPFTVLISPNGEVVWKSSNKLKKDELHAVLVEHTGLAQLP